MAQQTGPESGSPTVQPGPGDPLQDTHATRQQGAGGSAERTRQQHAGGERTRQQGTARGDRTRQHGIATHAESVGTPRFPESLKDRFEPLEFRGRGTEGAVWRCRRVDLGDEIAIKVHWAGYPIDQDLLRHLDNPRFHPHVPRIHGYGTFFTESGEIGWVAMEYLAENLRQHIENTAHLPFNEASVHGIVSDLAAALHFWQQVVERNPLDFKPDNLMIRTGSDRGFVLADFGGVAAFTASQQVGANVMAAVAYTPPEHLWQEKRSPWPWWSLGEIAYLLATGHTRFQQQPDQVIHHSRVLDVSVDVTDVADQRWQLLIRGLLTKDPHDRWGSAEVDQWCHGKNPDVVDPVVARTRAEEPVHRPITFRDGRSFNDPAKLAEAMIDDWRTAADWLLADGRQTLLDWLRQERLDKLFDTAHLRGVGTEQDRADRAILAFGAVFAPDVTPRWRGHPIDVDGLISLLGTGDRNIRRFGANQVLGLAAAYHCGHRDCVDRCAILDRAETTWQRLTRDAESMIADVATHSATNWQPLSDGERDRLSISMLWLLLAPAQAATGLRPTRPRSSADPQWWRNVRSAAESADPGTDAGRVALVVAVVLDERASVESSRVRDEAALQTRRRARLAARRVGAMALLFLAAMPASWLGVVLGMADTAFGPGAAFAADHADTVRHALAAPLFLVAVEAVLLGLRRPRVWLIGVCVLAGILGALAGQLPAFDVIGLPSFIPDMWSALSGFWQGETVVSAVAFGGLGLVCLLGAVRLLERDMPRTRRIPVGTLSGGRRAAAFPLAAVALLAMTWITCVVRYTLFNTPPVPQVALVGAADQSGLLLAILIVAAISAVAWPSTRWLLTVGMCAAIVMSTGSVPSRYLAAVWHPLAWPVLRHIGLAWGGGAIWAALLVYVPLAALCLVGMNRLAVR